MIKIQTRSHKYELAYAPVMQLVGQNIRVKNYIIRALLSFYSSDRISENDAHGVVSVCVDGEETGRKQFFVFRIRGKEELLAAIRLTKTSLLSLFLNELLSDFLCQQELNRIDTELSMLMERLNCHLAEIGSIELSYTPEDIWNIVQKTSVDAVGDQSLEQLSTPELLRIYFNLLNAIIEKKPERCLLVFENADHFLEANEYSEIVRTALEMAGRRDIHFIFTTSLDGYVRCDEDLISGITICNDEIMALPSIERIRDFIEEHYPICISFSEKDVAEKLEHVLQRVCRANATNELSDEVVLKMINRTIICSGKKGRYSIPEIEYLYGRKGGESV